MGKTLKKATKQIGKSRIPVELFRKVFQVEKS